MQDACEHLDEKMGYVKKLTDKLVKGIMENIPYSHYTGDPVNRLPGTASFVFEAIEGEGLILRLDNAASAGSTGSACSTGSLDPSHVLMAIGLPHEIAHGLSASDPRRAEHRGGRRLRHRDRYRRR